MTRLITEWISEMEETAKAWDGRLKEITGHGYVEIAAAVSGHSVEDVAEASETMTVAVTPITSGLGVIGNFSESVAAIVKAMGFRAFVTGTTDVDGMYEAKVRGADLVFAAEDNRYIALNFNNGKVSDNNIATAAGYAELLRKTAGNLNDKPAAVLGYGIVGQLLAGRLAEYGAKVNVYDRDRAKKELVDRDGYLWIERGKLSEYRYIADATCEGGWLSSRELAEDAFMAAPGIPLSLDEESREKMSCRYIHDMLEIGTAAMVGMAL